MTTPARVLHVEDDETQQNLVRIVLAHAGGFHVSSASHGFDAVRIAGDWRPDLLILDVGLPGINGADTLRALREIEGMKDVPVIFLTASGDLVTHVELLYLGALKVLRKPVRPYALASEVKRALGQPC